MYFRVPVEVVIAVFFCVSTSRLVTVAQLEEPVKLIVANKGFTPNMGSTDTLHVKASVLHNSLHQSPLLLFPSSHCSDSQSITPFQQYFIVVWQDVLVIDHMVHCTVYDPLSSVKSHPLILRFNTSYGSVVALGSAVIVLTVWLFWFLNDIVYGSAPCHAHDVFSTYTWFHVLIARFISMSSHAVLYTMTSHVHSADSFVYGWYNSSHAIYIPELL